MSEKIILHSTFDRRHISVVFEAKFDQYEIHSVSKLTKIEISLLRVLHA